MSPKSLAVRLSGDEFGLADVVRALDAEELHVEHLQLHAPSLDDVFLAKTGRTLEGAGAEQPESLVRDGPHPVAGRQPRAAEHRCARSASLPTSSRRSLFPTLLVAVNAAGLRPSTALHGFPTDSFLAFAIAVPFIQGALFATMNAGTDLARDIQTGFLNRLALTPMRGRALLVGHLAGVVALGLPPGRLLPRASR